MSEARTFLDGKVTLHAGDSRDVLKSLPDCCIDSVVTDPPYALVSIQKRFGKPGSAPVRVDDINEPNNLKAAYARASAGFMGKNWDTGETAFAIEFWVEVWRVLKPGGHVVAFSGTRTYHRMACAIEDAGFEIRDQIGWLFGSGFPKSHDVSKGIDRTLGAQRPRDVVPEKRSKLHGDRPWMNNPNHRFESNIPATATATAWRGWGTALKPAWEPVCLARKPIDETVAKNVLWYGTGALNIDECRVEAMDAQLATKFASVGTAPPRSNTIYSGDQRPRNTEPHTSGRWPANVIHDGSDEVIEAFPDTGLSGVAVQRNGGGQKIGTNVYQGSQGGFARDDVCFGDGGSAARFFYTAKADAEDRLGSKHPTVKPLDLMQYLVRLITPKGGVVLDPFAGTGTTGEAAWREGMRAILIEREPEYQADIERRLDLAAKPTKRSAVAATKNNLEDPNSLPLFAGAKT